VRLVTLELKDFLDKQGNQDLLVPLVSKVLRGSKVQLGQRDHQELSDRLVELEQVVALDSLEQPGLLGVRGPPVIRDSLEVAVLLDRRVRRVLLVLRVTLVYRVLLEYQDHRVLLDKVV